MPDPGIYAVNSTGELAPLATESGDGDRVLLHEMLDDLGVEHPTSDGVDCRADELPYVAGENDA